jgi:hypothetical protein
LVHPKTPIYRRNTPYLKTIFPEMYPRLRDDWGRPGTLDEIRWGSNIISGRSRERIIIMPPKLGGRREGSGALRPDRWPDFPTLIARAAFGALASSACSRGLVPPLRREFWMPKIHPAIEAVVTLLVLLGALYVILHPSYPQETQKWATGAVTLWPMPHA